MLNKKLRLNMFPALVCCLSLFVTVQLLAQSHKKTVLWEIAGNSLKEPSYLFGTVHIMDSSKYFLYEIVEKKLASSQSIVFEVNTNEPGYQQKALQYSFMKNDSLENILAKEEYHDVEQFFKDEFNFSLSVVHKMKPFYLAAVINALSMPKNAVSYEDELRKLAIEKGITIKGISTLEKETEIIDKMDMAVQRHTLFEAIKEHKSGYKRRETILKLYQQKDIDGIYEVMVDNSSPEDSVVYDIMFPNRHEVWIPSMVSLMKKQTCFFAVGVGHLPGRKGLIERFKEIGYEVKPLLMNKK